MGRQAEALVPARPAPRRAVQSPFEFLADTETDKEPVSLLQTDADTMRDAIAFWVELGNAITIGKTSDGGAIAVTLLAGGQRTSKYYADLDAFEQFLIALREGSRRR